MSRVSCEKQADCSQQEHQTVATGTLKVRLLWAVRARGTTSSRRRVEERKFVKIYRSWLHGFSL